MSRYDLSEFEWRVIEPLLPNKPRGVPRVDDRRVLNGIFWVLRSGSPWRDVPQRYGPPATCYNRFRRWTKAGIWDRLMDAITDAQGGEVDPKITEVEAGDIVIDVVEFAGEYQAMGSPSFTPGQIMIVGIVPGNTQHVFIRFTGPAATVEANREAFLEMLRGIHPVEPEK